MRLAVWESRTDPPTEDARSALDEVSVATNDFPWLEDVRIIAKARLLTRARDAEGAEKLVDEFMRRQRLLFEPWHAFHFGLLDEQEQVKGRYRAIRRSGTPRSAPTLRP